MFFSQHSEVLFYQLAITTICFEYRQCYVTSKRDEADTCRDAARNVNTKLMFDEAYYSHIICHHPAYEPFGQAVIESISDQDSMEERRYHDSL